MAEAIVDPRFPDVLIVTDPSFGLNQDHRGRLRELLDGGLTPLVSSGSHDYLVVHYVPDTPAGPNHTGEDKTLAPRPLRGTVLMEVPADTTDTSVIGYLGTLLEELGHHWLVPSDLAFEIDGEIVGMLRAADLVARANGELPWGQPALLGRSDRHWSSHMQGDGSSMDGVGWVDRGVQHGLSRWDQRNKPPVPISNTGSGPSVRTVRMVAAFNDLDLVLMGGLARESAYPGQANEVRWLEPTVTAGLQTYHGGITVALSRFDHICFGFYGDQRSLAVERIGEEASVFAWLGDDHDFRAQTALRVLRRGSQLLFQAAAGTADLVGGPDDLSPFPGGRMQLDDTFKTVATVNLGADPVAVGGLVRTWGPPGYRERGAFLTELEIAAMELGDSRGRRAFPTDRQPAPFTPGAPYSAGLSRDELRRHDVPAGPQMDMAGEVRTRQGMLQIVTRWGVVGPDGSPVGVPSADLTPGTDRAPKVLLQLGSGDFTFGMRCRVRRAVFGPAIAGGATGTTMWGVRRGVPTRSVVVPQHLQDKWEGNRHLRLAFVITAPDRSSVQDEHLQTIDVVRRFSDNAFNTATRGTWRSTSAMSETPQGDRNLGVFYRSAGDWLAWRLFDGTQWHADEVFNEHHQVPTRATSAPAVVSGWAGTRYAMFFRGEGDCLYWKAHQGGRWHAHTLVDGGGVLTSAPAVVAMPGGQLSVFLSPASSMGPPGGEFRQQHGTTSSPVMGPPQSIHQQRRR